MRLALQMRTGLERETLPSDYRRACLSLIKRATTEYAGGKYFEEFYQGNHTKLLLSPRCVSSLLPDHQDF